MASGVVGGVVIVVVVVVVLTLTLTSDDFESHIVVNVSSTSTNITIWFVAALCFIVDVWSGDDLTTPVKSP